MLVMSSFGKVMFSFLIKNSKFYTFMNFDKTANLSLSN